MNSIILVTLSLSVLALAFAVAVLARSSKSPTSTQPKTKAKNTPDKGTSSNTQILVDTSAIIDGRIADIVKTGFVPGKLLVPRFVLAELQNIADSEESMRRGRGRRGLEMLNLIRENPAVELDIIEEDPENVKEVDHKLVYLAREYGTNILTTDYNLNRVATIEQVKVLNINELANSIKAVVIPGEEMRVKVVQKGKEKNQGLAYLEDGTMIVVENGDKLLGKEISVEVTRIFQTVAGKMIFAVEKNSGRSNSHTSTHKSQNRKAPAKR